jgi:large subunit ribosomal protein L21e
MKKSRGFKARTRKALRQRPAFRPAITRFLQEFRTGQKVVIVINPSSHSGMPHSRYNGRVGIVKGKRGKSYIIEIIDGNKVKTLISRPEHLRVIE